MQQRTASASLQAGGGPPGYYMNNQGIRPGAAGSYAEGLQGAARRNGPNTADFPALGGGQAASSSPGMPPITPGGSYAQQAQASSSAAVAGANQGATLPQPPPGLQGHPMQQLVNGQGSAVANGLMQQGGGGSGDGLRTEDFPALGGQLGMGDGKDLNGRPALGIQAKTNPPGMPMQTGPSPSPPPASLANHTQPPPHLLQQSSSSTYPAEGSAAQWPQQQQQQPPQQPQPPIQQHDPSVPLTKPVQQLVTSPVDKWGLSALLALIRSGGKDDQLSLSLGEDLANIGLDMNSSAPLYPTFIAPWAEPESTRNVYLEEEYRIPQCYNVQTPPVSSKVAMFSDETLFYAFYSSPRDLLQMEVAAELYSRQWRYHKELGLWLTKDPGAEPIEKGPNYERGTYIVFDPAVFSRVETKPDFTLSYELLEDRPVVMPIQQGEAGIGRGGAQGEQILQGQQAQAQAAR